MGNNLCSFKMRHLYKSQIKFYVYLFLIFRIVPVKEASIVIAISSPHRKESLEAVHFAIDTVKAVVPIWKKVQILLLLLLLLMHNISIKHIQTFWHLQTYTLPENFYALLSLISVNDQDSALQLSTKRTALVVSINLRPGAGTSI